MPLEHSFENHALDHQRSAKRELQYVPEHAGDWIVGVNAAFQGMDEKQQVQRLNRVKKRLKDRFVQLALANGIADFQSFETHTLGLFRHGDRYRKALDA